MSICEHLYAFSVPKQAFAKVTSPMLIVSQDWHHIKWT